MLFFKDSFYTETKFRPIECTIGLWIEQIANFFTVLQQKFHNIFKVYDSNGELVFSFGSNGEGNGQFNAPTGVAVDSQVKHCLSD